VTGFEPCRGFLRGLLPSRRPKFLMMPLHNADLLVDTLPTAVSVIERQGFAYTAHQGTLLGAARLGGLLSWDVDADIGLLEPNAEKVRIGLEGALLEYRLALIFSPNAYYYTIRPFAQAFGKRVLLFPIIEVILVSSTVDPHTGEIGYDRHSPRRMFGARELLPLRRYAWHTSFISGPAQPEPVIGRLYGESGGPRAFLGHEPPRLSEEVGHFWQHARPLVGPVDLETVRARAVAGGKWIRLLRCAPWYAANGAYSEALERVRRAAGEP